MSILKKLYYSLPFYLQNFVDRSGVIFFNNIEDDFINNSLIGKNYGLNSFDKKKILENLKNSISSIDSATDINVHLILLKNILCLKKKNGGCIVECGSYKGATSIVLSIGAKITGRKLIIYDSFKGLPNGEKNLKNRFYPHLRVRGFYKKGMYKGNIEEVSNNIKKFGFIDVCVLRQGFFNYSLKKHKESIDFLFLDVDLLSSTKECLIYLWPHLVSGGYCYTDDACDLEVVKLWFDYIWWKKKLNTKAPGYIGSGCGIPILRKFSSLGYTIKNPKISEYDSVTWLFK